VVVGRSEIRAVRRMVKQLPAEMLQHWPSASSWMRKRTFTEKHYTVRQHSMSVVLNGLTSLFCVSQHTFDLIVWISLSAFPSFLRKELPSAFWQADVCLNYFGLFGEIYVHPLLWLRFDFNIHKWNTGFITCYLYDLWEIYHHLCAIALKWSKPKPFSAFCANPSEFSEPLLHKIVIA
jgi:hypothetical protein